MTCRNPIISDVIYGSSGTHVLDHDTSADTGNGTDDGGRQNNRQVNDIHGYQLFSIFLTIIIHRELMCQPKAEAKGSPATEPPSTEPPNTNEPESEQIVSETEQALE